MESPQTETWLEQTLQKHNRLTPIVVNILENILQSNGIDYLTITGRTKSKPSAIEKIKSKGYKDPSTQITDLSGIRVIVFLESDIEKTSIIINNTFDIDAKNSLNKDDLLSTNQIGYRSVHFVGDLGKMRGELPEFSGLSSLKFEIQLRTVLQHAWAELAHDRNYKFSGKLPRSVERKMYLYAGMLEIADKGFDELSKQIDVYIAELQEKSERGDLSSEVNSISLEKFINEWSTKNSFHLERPNNKENLSDLIMELTQFGVKTLSDLNAIIPDSYADTSQKTGYKTNIYGVIRDWMLLNNWRKFKNNVSFDWVIDASDSIFQSMMTEDEFREFSSNFEWIEGEEY